MTRTYRLRCGGSITSQVIAERLHTGNSCGHTDRKELNMSATVTAEVRSTAGDRGALLIRSIRLDALMSGASGLLAAAGATALDGVLGVSTTFLVALGVFLLAYAGGLLALARAGAPTLGVWAVIVGNALWVVASVVTVLADWLTLTTAGTVVTLVQAAAVALIAETQLVGLRRRG
jgi:hypothetical protein